ncbi:hypothetical protein HYW99_01295 [Candidatus Woesearchaeota archaeon]|nr:hypothetical protein [Candidatus Woesearchaeota archaeon]
MSLIQKIRPLAFGLGITVLTSCATIQPIQPTSYVEAKITGYDRIEEAMKILGLNNASWISYIGDDYLTKRGYDVRLMTLASIEAGRSKVRKIDGPDGHIYYATEGVPNPHDEATKSRLDELLREADEDTNRIIDTREIFKLTRRVYKQYAQ